jgi:TolB protein
VDVALGKTDFVELASLWSVESTNAAVYYKLLNAGFRLPITAGTDSFPNFHRNPAVGAVRVYANAGPTLTYEAWIEAILAGRSFVTSGPLLQFAVDGKGPGDTIQLSSNRSKVEVHGRADSIVPMRSVSIIRDGEVAARIDLGPAEESHSEFRRTIEVPESGWLALRVEGDGRPHHILMESAVFAHTAPVYVLRGGVPIRSVESAEYFLRWIDRSIELLQQERGWNSEAEQQHAIDVFRRGRKVYEDMLGRSDGGRP